MKWTEGNIGAALARGTFEGHLCVLPRCKCTGYEADLLVISRCVRIIDVEIKISRADLKADREKTKWWHEPPGHWNGGVCIRSPRVPLPWPRSVWKHYYAMPEEIWRDDLLEFIQPVSGVLLLTAPANKYAVVGTRCVKRAKANRSAPRLTESQVCDIARLASLRMWDAYKAGVTHDEAAA